MLIAERIVVLLVVSLFLGSSSGLVFCSVRDPKLKGRTDGSTDDLNYGAF